MEIDEKIETLGESFRGLWKSCEMFESGDDDEDFKDKWYVTFIYKCHYVETPAYDTAHEALDFAIEKHLNEVDEILQAKVT